MNGYSNWGGGGLRLLSRKSGFNKVSIYKLVSENFSTKIASGRKEGRKESM